LCRGNPGFDLRISYDVAPGRVYLKVEAVPARSDLSFVWEVQDGMPPMGNGPDFTTQIVSAGRKLVTVSAFTKEGCRLTQSIQVDVRAVD
jgi:hypothetical protein